MNRGVPLRHAPATVGSYARGALTLQITGASSGIGEATAEALAAEGAAVVLAPRSEDRLEDLVGRMNGKNGGKALAVAYDVTDEQQAHDLINRARDEFGRVDVLGHV